MKNLILILAITSLLSSCSYLKGPDKPEEELYIDIRTPHVQDMNFNETGQLPKDIKNQTYYDVDISGSALEKCEVVDYGDTKVRKSGKNKIFIGKAHDWDILRIDCRKNKGNGKSNEQHDLIIKIYSNDKIYHGKTEVKHE